METHNTREWEEPLMHIMESYIMTAELGHLAKDQLKHKQELRAYYAELVDFIHHQLQKARHDWLREEIVKLEGMKVENEHNSECLHNEAPEYCDCDNYIKWNKALQTIIDRYQAELDQPTEDKKYCNGEPCICGETK